MVIEVMVAEDAWVVCRVEGEEDLDEDLEKYGDLRDVGGEELTKRDQGRHQ